MRFKFLKESISEIPLLPTDEDIKNGNATFLGMKINYIPNAHYEGQNHDTYMNISNKFFDLSDDMKLHVLVHEVAHNISDDIMEQDWDGASENGVFVTQKIFPDSPLSKEYFELEDKFTDIMSHPSGNAIEVANKLRAIQDRQKDIVDELGKKPREYTEGIFGDIRNAVGETLAEAVTHYYLSPDWFKYKHPKAYNYIDKWIKSNKSKMWSR